MTTKIEVSDLIASVAGFQVAGIDAGLRKQPAPDLALIVMEAAGAAAGVFTSNKVQAAPVILDRALLADHPERIRAVLINAACANACTGEPGMENARSTQKWVAEMLGCQADEVLVMSTGVIGVQLPIEKMRAGIPVAAQSLSATNWAVAARAIMTTDTKPKSASVIADGYSIAGIAKGAGMIAPNMATLLSTVVTDAVISPALLQKALLEAVDVSFNRVVIDGDMSTNDTLLALASGRSGTVINEGNYPQFVASLTAVCENLSPQDRCRWRRRHPLHHHPCKNAATMRRRPLDRQPSPPRRWSRPLLRWRRQLGTHSRRRRTLRRGHRSVESLAVVRRTATGVEWACR
ncbi:MAG: bifunctional ornithine acetyltransferase/N-acetylglutamate synthase [Anaerolineae bacterium]